MLDDPEDELRRRYRDGVQSLVAMGVAKTAIAKAAGVHRSAAGRWMDGERLPKARSRVLLAEKWPHIFGYEKLAPSWLRALFPQAHSAAIGAPAIVCRGSAAVYEHVARAIFHDPVPEASRTIRHIGLHGDVPGGDARDSDDYFDGAAERGNDSFRRALVKRAVEDRWDIKTIVATNNVDRLDGLFRRMTEALDGPRVHVRAYRTDSPLVLNPLIVADREAILAFDDPRTGKPTESITFANEHMVGLLERYFNSAFDEAPYRLRTPRGLQLTEFDRMRRDIVEARRLERN